MAAPIPPTDVAGGTTATSAWATSVSDAVQQLIADLYPSGSLAMAWASITGKPATFAPTAHAHIDAASGGTLAYASLTGKPTTFAPTVHVHQSAAATGGQIAYADLTGKPTSMAPTDHTHPYGEVTSKPATFAPADHVASHRTGGGDALTAAQINGWARAAAGDALGVRIYVGRGVPSPAPAEGDVWIIG